MAHAFIADSGEEMEFLSIGGRNDSDAILSTPTRASGWWPGSSARMGSTGAWRGASKRRAASTASFNGELQRPTRPYSPKCLEREVPQASFGRG